MSGVLCVSGRQNSKSPIFDTSGPAVVRPDTTLDRSPEFAANAERADANSDTAERDKPFDDAVSDTGNFSSRNADAVAYAIANAFPKAFPFTNTAAQVVI